MLGGNFLPPDGQGYDPPRKCLCARRACKHRSQARLFEKCLRAGECHCAAWRECLRAVFCPCHCAAMSSTGTLTGVAWVHAPAENGAGMSWADWRPRLAFTVAPFHFLQTRAAHPASARAEGAALRGHISLPPPTARPRKMPERQACTRENPRAAACGRAALPAKIPPRRPARTPAPALRQRRVVRMGLHAAPSPRRGIL